MIRISTRIASTHPQTAVIIDEQNHIPSKQTGVAQTPIRRTETGHQNQKLLHYMKKLPDEGAPSQENVVAPLPLPPGIELGGEASSEIVETIDTGKHNCCDLL